MKKRTLSAISVLLIIVLLAGVFSSCSASKGIFSSSRLKKALENGGDYHISRNLKNVSAVPIMKDVVVDGKEHTLFAHSEEDAATVYQNENVKSTLSNIVFSGSEKADVGLWVGAGEMTYDSCTVSGYKITSNRISAIAAGGSSSLILSNTKLSDNESYDVNLADNASVSINGSTSLETMRISSNFIRLNIGEGWNGEFSITFDNPVAKPIGTVAEGASISKIKVTNDSYYLADENGTLMLKTDEEKAISFDMSKRETLYKGSTGFLYGAAEINVPSIDLLYGLQPDTMVQKTYAGKQHPTGDAVRTSSALLAAGVKDMQVYLQDYYLEWPYDAPFKNGKIDLDSYQKSVESMIYSMICDKVSQGTADAFKGSDGNYYKLNENRKNYSYVLFNEPNDIWFNWNEELHQKDYDGFKKAWKQIYIAVHNIDPEARCVGPNFSGFDEEQYDLFLKYCYDNNCLPEIITWHELGDISLTDFYKHYGSVESMVNKYYTEAYASKSGKSYQPELLVNEYARHYDIGAPGGLVKWLSMFEDKDMSACLAYWAMANSLNELAADQNSPSSSWWVYHWYAQMTGKQCPLASPKFEETRFYGVCSYDEKINTAYALFGGNEDQKGKETVYLNNINSTALANKNGAVNVRLYAVSFSGQLGANYKPEVIYDGALKTENNTLSIPIQNSDEMQAYFAVITKPDDDVKANNNTAFEYPVATYEAENAELIGGATAYDKGGWATFATSGRADVGSVNNNGDGVCFTVNIPESGLYKASLFYSLQSPYVNPQTLEPDGEGQNRGIGKPLPYGFELDGKKQDNIILESTVSWAYKNHCDIELYLEAGEHKLTFKQINGDEGDKGNLQLVAALDKLDIKKAEKNNSDFEIRLDEMQNFKQGGVYRITAVAPEEGYYSASADGFFTLKKQCVNYAPDAKSFSECSVYDTPVGKTLYLAKGANTLVVEGGASRLNFKYEKDKTSKNSTVVKSTYFNLFGNNAKLKKSSFANSGYVISELGTGQNTASNENAKSNFATFTVTVKKDGIYNLAVRYANDEPAPIMEKADGSTYIHPYNIDLVERYAQFSVNEGEPETVYFKNTLSWDTFKTLDIQLKLKKGKNTIKIYNDNSYHFSSLVNSTAPEIDTITVIALSIDN